MFILIFVVIPFILAVIYFITRSENWGIFAALWGTCTVVIGLTISAITIEHHVSDLGLIRAYQQVADQREKTVREMTKALQTTLPKGIHLSRNSLVINNDSPIATYFKELMRAKRALMNAREKIAKAKVRIAQRKAGPMWWVVAIYGEK